jgi:hypothetical protein
LAARARVGKVVWGGDARAWRLVDRIRDARGKYEREKRSEFVGSRDQNAARVGSSDSQ